MQNLKYEMQNPKNDFVPKLFFGMFHYFSKPDVFEYTKAGPAAKAEVNQNQEEYNFRIT